MILSVELYVDVKACATLEENITRQCDINVMERQQVYSEDWVRHLQPLLNHDLQNVFNEFYLQSV